METGERMVALCSCFGCVVQVTLLHSGQVTFDEFDRLSFGLIKAFDNSIIWFTILGEYLAK
jgi:hypothetical protein